MSNVETFSTIAKDGEDLSKINAWLNRFRCGEVLRFHVQRVTTDSTRILIEAQDHKRLRIVSSNPPHQSYMQTGKTIPYIDVHFSEPISLETFYGQVLINGTPVASNKLSTRDGEYTLRIDTTGLTLTTAGQYEVIFDVGVRHYNKIWPLYGERKVIWYTSEHGGTRGGVEIEDPEKCILNLARISVEGQHSEQKMLTEFYNAYGVDPDEVKFSRLTSGYPEHDRTTLWVIYCVCVIPYVKCTNPQYKACFYQDGAPGEVTVEMGFTRSILEESLEYEIEVDGVTVDVSKWELSQGGKLLTVKFTPTEYKHHEVKIATMKSGDFLRSWPYFFSFVIHKLFTRENIVKLYDDDESDYVGIKAPATLGVSYNVIMPAATPSSKTTMRLDTNGAIVLEEAPPQPVDAEIAFAHASSVIYGATDAGVGTVGDQSVFNFDDTVEEDWVIPMFFPKQVLSGGTIKAEIYWSATTTSANVKWAVSISARSAADNMAVGSYDTENTQVAQSHGTANCLVITSITLTNNDSIAPGQFFLLCLTRKAGDGADGLTGDASVYAVRVWADH